MHPTVQPARVASGSGCGAGSEEQVLGSALQSSANSGSGDGRILKEEKGKYGVESEGLQLSAYLVFSWRRDLETGPIRCWY